MKISRRSRHGERHRSCRLTMILPSLLLLSPAASFGNGHAASSGGLFGRRSPHRHSNADGARAPAAISLARSLTQKITGLRSASVAEPTTGLTVAKTLADDASFVKPDPDKRKYRAVRLANGLEALLVSDGSADVEAASVHVKAGHFDDPAHRPGLAHFHEHMLFLGTERYPEEDGYEKYLSENGGSANAYTAMEDTNYYFSVTPHGHSEEDGGTTPALSSDSGCDPTSAALSGALDRFSQFFISPLFKVEAVERELRAINSEYINGISTDAWRGFQLLKSGSNPDHPFHKFGCGNYNTLTNGGDIEGTSAEESGGSSPREDLIQFWKSHYHAGNIKLCVVGRADLDELQSTVEETFGQVKGRSDDIGSASSLEVNGHSDTATTTTSTTEENKQALADSPLVFHKEHSTYGGIVAFGPSELGLIREVIPVTNTRSIKVSFAIPPLDDPIIEKSKPYRVISHLLGHESPGSLHSLLNDNGFINGLSSGTGVDTSSFGLFTLSLSLTPAGMEQKDLVLSYVFQWIALIKRAVFQDEDNLMEKYHEELNQISSMHFKFREASDPADFVSFGSEAMFDDLAPNHMLRGSAEREKYDLKVTKAFIERLVPSNAFITVSDQSLKEETDDDESGASKATSSDLSAAGIPWEKELWYRAEFRQMPIPSKLTELWDSPTTLDPRLYLPKLNEYIPTDFSLRCDNDKNEVNNDKDNTLLEASTTSQQPPTLLESTPQLRLWHKMDAQYRVPKTAIKVHITSPHPYSTPRTMTLCRLYQKLLNDDLSSFVYDAGMAGCSYRVTCTQTGYEITLSGYSEKLPVLLDTLTARMIDILGEMKEGAEKRPGVERMFQKAVENLKRETENTRMEAPHGLADYTSRLVMEERTWHIDNYIEELARGVGMEECADAVMESLTGRVKVEVLCMGNIDTSEATRISTLLQKQFLLNSSPLSQSEVPTFRSFKIPTKAEFQRIYPSETAPSSIPLISEEAAPSLEEENNAVEIILQAGCDLTLGYEGIAILELIGYLAYNSAFAQLRTKEQLGYLVSSHTRKTAGGARGLVVVVQSSSATPAELQERCEAWLKLFRTELEDMKASKIAKEASAIVAQILERDRKLSDEISRYWGEIKGTEQMSDKMKMPEFGRVEKVAKELMTVASFDNGKDVDSNGEEDTDACDSSVAATGRTAEELKEMVLSFFDQHFAESSDERRAMACRVYGQKSKGDMAVNSDDNEYLSDYGDICHLKQYLSSWPMAPSR